MRTQPEQEKLLAVTVSWALFGLFGVALILTGFASESVVLGAAGYAMLIAGFVAHIIINNLLHQGFTTGETVVGIMAYGAALVCFVASWAMGVVTGVQFLVGIVGFAAIILGFTIYFVTAYGLKGAFSMFHSPTRGS